MVHDDEACYEHGDENAMMTFKKRWLPLIKYHDYEIVIQSITAEFLESI